MNPESLPNTEQPGEDQGHDAHLEMVYVLFMDIVGYSRLATDRQQDLLRRLQTIVRATGEFKAAQQANRLIRLPTGDGMALAFFTNPESPARCAVEIARALKSEPDIPLRMGMHAGPVFRVPDINANQNIAGEGINVAQRVMDAGDAGHLLVSKSLADVLRNLTGWQGNLHDLGELAVKHGLRIHIYNLLAAGVGNPATPKKFQAQETPEKAKHARGVRGLLFILGVAAVVAATLALVFFRPNLSVVHARRPKVAVLGFKNLTATQQDDWVSTSLESMLSAELTAGDHVVTVPGETVAQARSDLALPDADSYGPETLARVRKRLDCDYVIYGSFFDTGKNAGGRLQVQFHMQNTDTGEMVASAPQTGNELAINELASSIGATLRGKLNLPGISSAESNEIQAAIPSTQEARVLYSQGVAQLRTLDLLGARTSFEGAIAADPNFSLAHADLAEVWKGLGYDDKARAEAKIAFDLSSHLGNEDRASVEARYRETASEWEKSIDLYRSLWILGRMQTPEYAYRAADVQIRAGKATDALQTVAALRQQPGELANSPTIDLREAEAFESLGDVSKEAAAAKLAAEKAHAIGARSLESEALWRACGALAAIGDVPNATSACDRSVEIAKEIGNRLLVARALSNLGNIATGHGDYSKAILLHRQALQIARTLGSQRDVVGALSNIGDALSYQGDHAAAQESYQAAMRIAVEINDRSAILRLQNDLAAEHEAVGDFGKALQYFHQSLSIAEANGDQAGIVDAKTNIGSLEALRGNLADGLKLVRRALDESNALGLKAKSAQLELMIGDILLRQGETQAAEKMYADVLDRAGQLADANLKASAQLAMGGLALEKGNSAEAERLTSEAAAGFHAAPNADMECSALLIRVNALIEQKRYAEAATALAEAQALKSQDIEIRLTANLAAGRLLARQGRFSQAKDEFGQVTREAGRLGLPELAYLATLAVGELDFLQGDKTRAELRLQQLEKKARASGYEGIARRSQTLRTGPA